MARGGRNNCRKYSKKRDLSKNKGSDESDEDYVVSDEENGASDEDYCSSLDECASEEGFDSFVDNEEEEGKARKVVRSKSKSSPLVSKKVRSNTVRKRRQFYRAEDEDEDEDEDYNVDDDDEEEDEEKVMKLDRSEAKKDSPAPQVIRSPTLQEKRRVHSDKDEDGDYNVDEEEEEEDENEEDSGEYEDDDEEFTLEEDDFSDEEKESRVKKKNNMRPQNQGLQRKGPSRSRKRRRKTNASIKPSTKQRRKNSGLRRKSRHSNDGDLIDNNSLVMEVKTKKRPSQRKRRYVAKSDSDFVSSGASDYDYTISEEEREQVREAKELCGSLEINLRSSIPRKIPESEDLRQERKPVRKGKEKVEEVKAVVVKQVCGICLSEEDQRRVRGTLNCCTHYFCFSCIMEWAKVESRCPLCKQRFTTISKPARSAAGVDLREVVITVPERDQVYLPSEEELRSYLDPYENVICTECNEGGDDGLMLLCDLCDSPAHTYCVGLGREVPEGNWYCDGCKPVVLASNSQAQGHFTDGRFTTNNSSSNGSSTVINNGEGIDLNAISSPRTPFTQAFGNLLSPRFQMGPPTSPVSGTAASTLSGRRWRQRNIHQLLLSMNGIGSGIPADNMSNDVLNTQTDHGGETTLPYQIFLEERLQENPSPSVCYEDVFSLGSVPFRRQAFHNPSSNTSMDRPLDGTMFSPMRRHLGQNQTTFSTDRHINGTLRPELGVGGRSSVSGYHQLNPCSSRLYTGSGNSLLPCTVREDNQFVKEQLPSMIQCHLKKLPQSIDLGQSSSEEISRIVTQTILASCGLDQTSNGTYSLPPPPACSHIELMAGGSISLSKGCCSSCFDSFVGDVVKNIMMDTTKSSQWLSLRL